MTALAATHRQQHLGGGVDLRLQFGQTLALYGYAVQRHQHVAHLDATLVGGGVGVDVADHHMILAIQTQRNADVVGFARQTQLLCHKLLGAVIIGVAVTGTIHVTLCNTGAQRLGSQVGIVLPDHLLHVIDVIIHRLTLTHQLELVVEVTHRQQHGQRYGQCNSQQYQRHGGADADFSFHTIT